MKRWWPPGWGDGLLGVLIFSGSLPATRVAVAQFSPLFLTAVRALIAALLGAGLLLARRQRRPARSDLAPLVVVATGVVIGFPLFTALALEHINAARSIVFIGLLPLVTAAFGVLRAGERPSPAFWSFSALGSATVAAFALTRHAAGALSGDLCMLAAIVLCGLGYAEGTVLARRLGGWQVICWALVLAAPAMAVLALVTWPTPWRGLQPAPLLGLGYVSVFSMLLGFVFWYRGLAVGGIAKVGQLQLLQPLAGLALAGLLLHEPVDARMLVATVAVVACVGLARRFA